MSLLCEAGFLIKTCLFHIEMVNYAQLKNSSTLNSGSVISGYLLVWCGLVQYVLYKTVIRLNRLRKGLNRALTVSIEEAADAGKF